MHLTEITNKQPKEILLSIKNGRECDVRVFILNDEYKVIHVFYDNQNRVSVSHLNFEKVPSEILQYLTEDYLQTYESNIYLFTLGDGPIVHIHHEINTEIIEKEESAHDYKS